MADAVPAAAEDLLTSEPLMAHLATSHDDRPHVAPLWYVYRDGVVELTTTGRKLANLRTNPRVALSVQKDVDGEPQWGVTLRGTATVIEDDAEAAREIRHRVNRKYGADDDEYADNASVRIDVADAEYWEY
ncbi:MAG: pyridoxamine 5'-phosphate oxidase family protein [Haloarculaceae archaeon]